MDRHFRRNCIRRYRIWAGTDHPVGDPLTHTTLRELLFLTGIIAVAIVLWNHNYTHYLGDHPYEVFNDFALGIRAFIALHSQ